MLGDRLGEFFYENGDVKMLELRNIHKSFGDVRVLGGVNLRLEKGFIYTLKGGNGSGKTTLINIVSGFLKPDEGSVELKGEKIVRFLPFRVNRLGIRRTFQDLRLATQMTVYENILLSLKKRKVAYPKREQQKYTDEILKIVSLLEKRQSQHYLDLHKRNLTKITENEQTNQYYLEIVKDIQKHHEVRFEYA
jgi:ABC-type branched-subunit amino acid transport system ATPase component